VNQAFVYFEVFAVAALGLVGIADLVFFVLGGKGMTLSSQFWKLSKQWPFVPAVLGVVFGHLVWQYNPDCEGTMRFHEQLASHTWLAWTLACLMGPAIFLGYVRSERQP
jgi:hypothetical protein